MSTKLSYANDISFTCHGIMTSTAKNKTDQLDSGQFDLMLDPVSGQIWGFPNMMAWGCAEGGRHKLTKNNFQMTPLGATRQCQNNEATSTLIMSRNTGNLQITTVRKWTNYTEFQDGTYFCQKVTNKVF